MNDGIIFASTGLLIYWMSRVTLLIVADEEEIESTLRVDLWWGRRLWDALRSTFGGSIAAV